MWTSVATCFLSPNDKSRGLNVTRVRIPTLEGLAETTLRATKSCLKLTGNARWGFQSETSHSGCPCHKGTSQEWQGVKLLFPNGQAGGDSIMWSAATQLLTEHQTQSLNYNRTMHKDRKAVQQTCTMAAKFRMQMAVQGGTFNCIGPGGWWPHATLILFITECANLLYGTQIQSRPHHLPTPCGGLRSEEWFLKSNETFFLCF